MISQTVEYALRAIVTIAQHGGAPCTAQQISAFAQIPAPYLSKLMQGLVHAKLLTSKRGVHGGFMLTKAPHALTIWEVIDAVEPLRRTHGPRRRAGTPKDGLASLSQRLDQTIAMMEKSLRNTTVAELVTRSGREGKGKRLPETRTTRSVIKQSTTAEPAKRKTSRKKKG